MEPESRDLASCVDCLNFSLGHPWNLCLSFSIHGMGCHSLPTPRAGWCGRAKQAPEFPYPHGTRGRKWGCTSAFLALGFD